MVDKSDPLAATTALCRRLFETLARGILRESPQGWVHGVFEKPPAKRPGCTLRSTSSSSTFPSLQQRYGAVHRLNRVHPCTLPLRGACGGTDRSRRPVEPDEGSHPNLCAIKKPPTRGGFCMAVREGYTRAHPCALPLRGACGGTDRSRRSVEPDEGSHPNLCAIKKPPTRGGFCMAVREGFEPSIPFGIPAFQASAFSHSATSP